MRGIGLRIALILAIIVAAGTFSSSVAQAAEDQPQVKMTSERSSLSDTATRSFSYDIEIQYTGAKDKKVFALSVAGPGEYTYEIQNTMSVGIRAIELDPAQNYPQTIRVNAIPVGKGPKPGEYTIILTASADNLKTSIILKAVVTARYGISVYTSDGILNTDVSSGKDNAFLFIVKNTGDSPLENVKFRQYVTGMPSGWRVTFKPENIETLASNSEQKVELNIHPSEKTIAGDYFMNLAAETDTLTAEDTVNIRVSVITPLLLTITGILLIILVIAALILLYINFGRKGR